MAKKKVVKAELCESVDVTANVVFGTQDIISVAVARVEKALRREKAEAEAAMNDAQSEVTKCRNALQEACTKLAENKFGEAMANFNEAAKVLDVEPISIEHVQYDNYNAHVDVNLGYIQHELKPNAAIKKAVTALSSAEQVLANKTEVYVGARKRLSEIDVYERQVRGQFGERLLAKSEKGRQLLESLESNPHLLLEG